MSFDRNITGAAGAVHPLFGALAGGMTAPEGTDPWAAGAKSGIGSLAGHLVGGLGGAAVGTGLGLAATPLLMHGLDMKRDEALAMGVGTGALMGAGLGGIAGGFQGGRMGHDAAAKSTKTAAYREGVGFIMKLASFGY